MSQKKIYIEGLAVVEGHFSGIGQYTLGILRGIDSTMEARKLAGESVPIVAVIIPYDTVSKFRTYGFKYVTYKRAPFSFRVMSALWHRGKMPPLDLFCGRGTYLFTRFVSMPLLFSKSAVIIYDLSYELFKQHSDDRNAQFLSKGVLKSLQHARKIITISKSVEKEIIDFYKYPAKDIVVAYPAADQQDFYKRSPEEIDKVKRKYEIEGDYILTLSNLEPRKNLDGLVDAYCQLPKKITDDVGLLMVGVNGWKIEKLFDKIIGKVGEGYNIIRPSHYVSDADKPAIISGARMLVYPSHYEGFGMPPLEALACGVPVITSDNSSLPEVVGHAGDMVNSTDISAISEAIAKGINAGSKLSKQMQIAGPRQAAHFSWEKSSAAIMQTLEDIS